MQWSKCLTDPDRNENAAADWNEKSRKTFSYTGARCSCTFHSLKTPNLMTGAESCDLG